MTNRPALLRQIYTEARPYVEQLVELNVAFTGFRKLASDNGLDWGQIKALLRAEIEDGEAGGSEKVDRIIQKAEFAGEYAALLGLGSANMNEQNSISEGGEHDARRLVPPHDPTTGEIIEPASAPYDAEAGQEGEDAKSCIRTSSVAPPTISDVPANGPATAPASGAGSAPITAKGDAGETDREATGNMLAASPINSNTPGQSGTAREAPSQSRDTVRCPTSEGEGTSSALSPINSEHDAQREATVETTSPAPAAESPASSQGPCSHGSGAVQDRCESTAPSHPAAGAAEQGPGIEEKPVPGPDLSVSTRRNEGEGDAAQPEERGTRTHHAGSTDGGSHVAAPELLRTFAKDTVDISVETSGVESRPAPEVTLSTSDPALPQASEGRLTKQETGDPVGSEAASADFLIAGKSPDPIASIPGEWPDLPPQFDRRSKAA